MNKVTRQEEYRRLNQRYSVSKKTTRIFPRQIPFPEVNILHFIGKLFQVKIGIFGLTFHYLLTKSIKMKHFSPLLNGE